MVVTQGPRSQVMSNGISLHFMPSPSLHAFASTWLRSQKRMTFALLFTLSPLQRDALVAKHCHQRWFITVDCSRPQIVLDGGGGETNANFISSAYNHLTDAGFHTFQLLLLVFMTANLFDSRLKVGTVGSHFPPPMFYT